MSDRPKTADPNLVSTVHRLMDLTGMTNGNPILREIRPLFDEIERLRGQLAEARELLIEWRELRGAPLILASLTDTWLAASSEPPQSAPARAPATSPPR